MLDPLHLWQWEVPLSCFHLMQPLHKAKQRKEGKYGQQGKCSLILKLLWGSTPGCPQCDGAPSPLADLPSYKEISQLRAQGKSLQDIPDLVEGNLQTHTLTYTL